MTAPAWYTDPSWSQTAEPSFGPVRVAGGEKGNNAQVSGASDAASPKPAGDPKTKPTSQRGDQIMWNQQFSHPAGSNQFGATNWNAAIPVSYASAGYATNSSTPPGYVKYVPVGASDTHSVAVGYALWLIGFTGAHRFYYGKPLSGLVWFFTFGLLGLGWLIDAFLIPAMDREADRRYRPGRLDYNAGWLLLLLGGIFGLHRFYQGKIASGAIYLLTGGLFGLGYIYDILTLNTQIDHVHATNENPIYT